MNAPLARKTFDFKLLNLKVFFPNRHLSFLIVCLKWIYFLFSIGNLITEWYSYAACTLTKHEKTAAGRKCKQNSLNYFLKIKHYKFFFNRPLFFSFFTFHAFIRELVAVQKFIAVKIYVLRPRSYLDNCDKCFTSW